MANKIITFYLKLYILYLMQLYININEYYKKLKINKMHKQIFFYKIKLNNGNKNK